MIYPVILCGGSGTRLWPLSRQSYPKQFTKIIGETSLFQQSALRCASEEFAPPVIVTGEQFRFTVVEQLAQVEISPSAILIEPEGKNTAPAVFAAALYIYEKDPDAQILVMPSDHVIPNAKAFQNVVAQASTVAGQGNIITFGIKPTGPETGYGYLKLADANAANVNIPTKLDSFVEKPDLEKATTMLSAGGYLWNAGIFLFNARTIIDAFDKYAKGIKEVVTKALHGFSTDLGFTRIDATEWAKVKADSIDYAIMEKADNIYAMPFNDGWSDLGGWAAVWQESNPDSAGNVTSESATAIDCKDTLLRSETPDLELVGIGLDDIITIAMHDAVVVAKKSEAHRVKEAVSTLQAKGKKQATHFPKENRPWGWYETLALGNRFQVKRICVKPGGSLSLQSHFHRAEHWVVVEGTAKITLEEKVHLMSENQSIYIPIGAKHRLENPGKLPVLLIEVQTGSYLGEDDIVRYGDVYGR
ncbi:mannose-1-phosphate guanylyltransferase/mannose-6-phosphate isomerase [Pseudaquidulcibacter saccharophilus]|uniref:mannose-1-phosphate guanylyltransferase/mannose-6-phosphate isomerase n=1 Tax=Pseudaquidulcibacter saccharophilus TaxID=2831900 RepID=UPI0023D93206|nr:mannose-1-phosphate guanylyltransferase/mannose-6-phosphate isomerase [Pseudaquidulcibacter saccharophilus]